MLIVRIFKLAYLIIYFPISFYIIPMSAQILSLHDIPLKNSNEINVLQYGAIGDGITDDTLGLNKAFKVCSDKNLICKLPKNKIFLVTGALYLWGGASLIGEERMSTIKFKVSGLPYLLNIGISGRNKLEKSFTGIISKINFKIAGGKGGRIIFLWRTHSASIQNNSFDIGEYAYSATSSGNDNNWVKNGFKNTIRKNITIKHNIITAKVNNAGSEGIGLSSFDGALITDNIINGVGDDPIGIHSCKNIKILRNTMKSVDGRLLVVNSKNIVIADNIHHRVPSLIDNKFYRGISLLYIGFENLNKKNSHSAPTNISIYRNYLYYPQESIDAGAAIYIYGPRNVNVYENKIVNDSNKVIASAIHILPARFSVKWNDPEGKDNDNIAKVRGISVNNNIMSGAYPQKITMTGNCNNYIGKMTIKNNTPSNFQSYCP